MSTNRPNTYPPPPTRRGIGKRGWLGIGTLALGFFGVYTEANALMTLHDIQPVKSYIDETGNTVTPHLALEEHEHGQEVLGGVEIAAALAEAAILWGTRPSKYQNPPQTVTGPMQFLP